MKVTAALPQAMLTATKTLLDAGFCYIFAGDEPATAGEALDMVATHTQLAKLTLTNDGTTGLTFDAAVAMLLAKPSSAVWEGTNAFDGFEDATATLTPTFFRFCTAADNGRGVSALARIQGTVGGPASADEMKLEGDTLTDNGINTAAVATFNARLTPVG